MQRAASTSMARATSLHPSPAGRVHDSCLRVPLALCGAAWRSGHRARFRGYRRFLRRFLRRFRRPQDLHGAGFGWCFGTNSVANFGGANPNFRAYSFAYRVSLCALRTVPFVMTLVRNPARGRVVGGGHAGGGRCRFSSSNQSPWLGGTMTSTSMPFSASRCAAR